MILEPTITDEIVGHASSILSSYFDEVMDVGIISVDRIGENCIICLNFTVRNYKFEKATLTYTIQLTPYVITYPSVIYVDKCGILINLTKDDINYYVFSAMPELELL